MAINIPIITEFDGKGIQRAIKEFQQLETTGQKAQFAIKQAAIPAAAALSGLAVVSKRAVNAASDLAEAQAAVGVIFGASADEIEDFSKTAATNIGQSRRQVLQAAQTFGAFGKQAGLSGDALAKFSTDFVALASDLASFKDTSPEEAITAIGAALRGEAEPIRRYNVLLDDATLRQKAVELQLIKTTKEALTPQNKVLAAQAAIYEQTRDAQGDFARTSDGVANSSRTLTAQLEDVSASFGDALLPAIEAVLPLAKDFADWAKKNPGVFQAIAAAIAGIAAATLAVNIAMATNPYVLLAAGIVAIGFAADRALQPLEKMGGLIGKVAGFLGRGLLGDLSDLFGKVSEKTNVFSKAQAEAADMVDLVNRGLGDLIPTEKNLATTTDAGTKKIDERTAALKAMRKEIAGDFKDALSRAKDVVKNAQTEFANFAKSVSESVTRAFSFRDAQAAAKEAGTSFLSELEKQVVKTRDFSVKINRLLAAGLSEDALQQVLAAGVEAGGAIADELLNGGAAAIGQANALTAEVQKLGTSVGQNAATQFKQAGIDAGNAMVAGITETISQFKVTLKSKNLSKKQLKKLRQDFGLTVDFIMSGGNIPALGDGGIVQRPTLALIGEKGPEAVVPLDQYGSAGMSGGITITVNAGLVSTPDQIGQEIIQAIQKAQRRSGVVFAPA